VINIDVAFSYSLYLLSEVYLWNFRLGNIRKSKIENMIKLKLLSTSKNLKFENY
jgi:hypothetical protein